MRLYRSTHRGARKTKKHSRHQCAVTQIKLEAHQPASPDFAIFQPLFSPHVSPNFSCEVKGDTFQIRAVQTCLQNRAGLIPNPLLRLELLVLCLEESAKEWVLSCRSLHLASCSSSTANISLSCFSHVASAQQQVYGVTQGSKTYLRHIFHRLLKGLLSTSFEPPTPPHEKIQ